MTLETQMTLALLQELLMAIRANDADGYKSWLALGIEELGRDIAACGAVSWHRRGSQSHLYNFDVRSEMVTHCLDLPMH